MISRVRAVKVDGRVFVLLVVVGGMLALQSSQNLDAMKVVYLLLAGLSLAGAIVSGRWWLSSERATIAISWLLSVAAFAALLLLSVVVSMVHGTSMSSWLRDAAAYALFGAAPVFGLLLARSASRRWITNMIAVCGALASISFAVEWLGLRHFLTLPIDRIVLPSSGLACGLLALATALAMTSAPRGSRWAVLAGTLLGLFFVTGTRATLLLLAVPIGAGLLAGRPRRLAGRMLVAEVAVALAVFAVGATVISLANGSVTDQTSSTDQTGSAKPAGIGERIDSVGTLVLRPGSDFSFQERATQTKVAWETFLTSPLVGVGPGYSFTWTGIAFPGMGNAEHHQYTLDTPLVYLAKFGLIGLIPLLLFVGASLRLAFALWRRRSRTKVEFLAICGYGIVLAVTGVLVSPMEDKGVAFALILLIGFGCGALIRSNQEDSAETDGGSVSRGIEIPAQ